MSFNINQLTTELARKTAEHTEVELLSQLTDFISRDLIHIEHGPAVLVRDQVSDSIQMQRTVKLVLKDKEYIESLEKENSELKDILSKLKACL